MGAATTGRRATTGLRRGLVTAAMFGLLALATACVPAPPVGPVPVIESATATPVVEAGEAVTATIVAGPPVGIYFVHLEVFGPNGALLPSPLGSGDCSSSGAVDQYVFADVGEPFTATCRMPEYASNGTWMLKVIVVTSGFKGSSTMVPFEVVGGIDDVSPPVVTTLTAPAGPVVRGTSFDLAFRIEDVSLFAGTETSPANFRLTPPSSGGAMGFHCVDHQTTPVSPTVLETSMTCPVPANMPAGTYVVHFDVKDRLSLTAEVDVAVVVVA